MRRRRSLSRRIPLPVSLALLLPIWLLAAAAGPAAAAGAPVAAPPGADAWTPPSLTVAGSGLPAAPLLQVAPVALESVQAEDARRRQEGLPPRYAIPREVLLTPGDSGRWATLDGGLVVWRLRVAAAGALSINLGFTRYRLPAGAALHLRAAGWEGPFPAGGRAYRFTAADNERHGQLWTPVVLGEEAILELIVPAEARDRVELELTSINVGYRGFGEPDEAAALGRLVADCYVDTSCPQADPWRDAVRAVGGVSTGGSIFCTGTMINNVAEDERPFFLTAFHCGLTLASAPSLVVYWNFEKPVCDGTQPGPLDQWQTGSLWRAGWIEGDFTLVELDDLPDPTWGVTYAGWDRRDQAPLTSTCIHHPDGTEKRISFDYDPARITSYSQVQSPGDGTHLEVVDWDVGSTEPGSSGAPLFDQNHRVVGQLHGGYAACGNDLPDWFGRLHANWEGGGNDSERLRNWLDPAPGTGALFLDTLDPQATGLGVTPYGDLLATGPLGGPFALSGSGYRLTNHDEAPLSYQVATDAGWLQIDGASGTLPAGGSVTIGLTVLPAAELLPEGIHVATLAFAAPGQEGIVREVRLTVGTPHQLESWPLDTDPGWATQGAWAFGRPQGGRGDYELSKPDPTSGYTGQYVYGYNLGAPDGGYANFMTARSLRTLPIDCSDYDALTLRFRRWLGVEERPYDAASIDVSTDGASWTPVWRNVETIDDGAWTLQDVDISFVADRQPVVYIRWLMGPTDGSWTFCGWNLDDIELRGLDRTRFPGEEPEPTVLRLVGAEPNPFRPAVAPVLLRFELAAAGPVRLRIYDLRGRQVRDLLDEVRPAEAQFVPWNGRDDRGRLLPAGAYLLRMEAGGRTLHGKVLLLR